MFVHTMDNWYSVSYTRFSETASAIWSTALYARLQYAQVVSMANNLPLYVHCATGSDLIAVLYSRHRPLLPSRHVCRQTFSILQEDYTKTKVYAHAPRNVPVRGVVAILGYISCDQSRVSDYQGKANQRHQEIILKRLQIPQKSTQINLF